MASLESITPIIKALLPKCPNALINRHLHKTARELCRLSLAWTSTVSVESAEASDFPYTLADSDETRIVKILSVRVDGVQMEMSDIATEEYWNDDWRVDTGVPLRFIEESPGVLLVVPLPDVACAFEAEVAVEPAAESMEIDAALLLDQEDTLVAGTVYRLCMIPGQPWTSPDMAAYYKEEVHKGIEDAKVNIHKNRRVGSSLTMSTRPFEL